MPSFDNSKSFSPSKSVISPLQSIYFSKKSLICLLLELISNIIVIFFSLNLVLFSSMNLIIFLAGPNFKFKDKRSYIVNKGNTSPVIYSLIKIFFISSFSLNSLHIYRATSSFVDSSDNGNVLSFIYNKYYFLLYKIIKILLFII